MCAYPIVVAIARWIADSISTKGSQLFIGTHNEVLTGVAMRVNSEDCSSARIHA
jgi:hypothetical protein